MLGFGGDALIKGAVGLAARLGLSKLFIGLVLVGFGTSTPELATSVGAALQGSPGIAVGNVIGSNIANILLILGAAASVAVVRCDPAAFRRDAPVLAAATLAAAAMTAAGGVGRAAGVALVAGLAAYLAWTFRDERAGGSARSDVMEREADLIAPAATSIPGSLVWLAGGVGLVIGGAAAMVAGASALAAGLGVSEAVIGLTIVAVGTSLPEFAASFAAARKGEADLAYGNIIGSNIFNILGILGLTAAIAPVEIDPAAMRADALVMAAATAVLFIFAWTGNRLSRAEGAALLLAYGLYLTFAVYRETIAG